MQRETHQMEICPQKSDVKSPNSASGMKKTCKTALEINTENANDTVLIAAISENRSRELGTFQILMGKKNYFYSVRDRDDRSIVTS